MFLYILPCLLYCYCMPSSPNAFVCFLHVLLCILYSLWVSANALCFCMSFGCVLFAPQTFSSLFACRRMVFACFFYIHCNIFAHCLYAFLCFLLNSCVAIICFCMPFHGCCMLFGCPSTYSTFLCAFCIVFACIL